MRAERMEYLENGTIRLGIDLELGGAITYLGLSGGANLINSFDWGRQVQMSYYSGPVPFAPHGKKPRPEWAGLGWNPIQSGDSFGYRSRVLDFRRTRQEMTVRAVPMQWPLENEPGECTFESWLKLDGAAVQVRARLTNRRADRTQYPGRDQELPAVYTNGPYYRLFTYDGDRPFEGAPLTRIPPAFPWKSWHAAESWAALVDEKDFGLGVWHPGAHTFLGGFAGTPGAGGPKDGPTGYIAPLHQEILDHNIVHDYRYTLIVGTLETIRGHVYRHTPRRPPPPRWRFATDRQHWHYGNATDTGWPIRGELDLPLEGDDPMLIGPAGLWRADEAPRLVIEAACRFAAPGPAQLFWSRLDAPGFAPERSVSFSPVADGRYRTYAIDLSRAPEYRGAITRLRLDPVPTGQRGDFFRLRTVGFPPR